GGWADFFLHSGARLPLRAACVPPRCDSGAESAHHGDGVCVGDGGEERACGAAHDRGADDALAGRPLAPAASSLVARRLETSPLPVAVQPALALLLPRTGRACSGACTLGRAAARAASGGRIH